jgi:glucose/arabinose dehydrogenase
MSCSTIFGLRRGRGAVWGLGVALAFPAGLDAQPPGTPYKAVAAFPELAFDNPLCLTFPPDGSNRVFVAEQDGRIWWFENQAAAASRRLALDITRQVRRVHNEEGLLGFAFHPKFKDNRHVFLQYSASRPRRNVISRFRMDKAGEMIDPASEEVFLEVEQPYGNHNGGMLAFGPDGFLYISLGDGGSAGDPHNNGQSLRTLLGKILRIDVDRREAGRPYAVPRDNPFRGRREARPEIWAWGLRNVWRFSFDRNTGRLWAADVGQNAWEEVDVIEKGGNYGWNCREAKHPFRRNQAGCGGPFIDPVAEHDRGEAQSLTGGYVYRGKKRPELAGAYVYGDFMTGNIWSLDSEGGGSVPRLLARGELVSSFGEDRDGELYFTSFDGKIYTLRKQRP